MRHPHHDAVAAEVASWYTTSAPAMGLVVEERWCGIFTTPASLIGPRAVLRLPDVEAVAPALDEVRSAFTGADSEVEVWIEGRDATDRFDGPLDAAGCARRTRTVYLALAGDLRVEHPAPPGLAIEEVGDGTLPEWVAAQRMAFAHSEERPTEAAMANDIELRGVELADVGRLWLARLDGEVVATLAFYDGDDRLVNSLGTRVPYRGRGIAQALLAAFVDDSERRGSRSSLINADDDDWPVTLYRRMGFSDEILFHGRYVLAP
jgi:GNAT superfamily N-acetyltransferase